ncbi:MAG: LysR family transcriptional regulator, partial [Gammaproteobacteria bacterium]|nr:LysR family transcriptional regulator [Gammaproteobacteria bacterium]
MAEKKKKKRCRLGGRIWIEGPEGTFLGYGRVVLLERIREHGSISAAARSMEMSYRHAWELVDSMNRQSRSPVVVKSTGGR